MDALLKLDRETPGTRHRSHTNRLDPYSSIQAQATPGRATDSEQLRRRHPGQLHQSILTEKNVHFSCSR